MSLTGDTTRFQYIKFYYRQSRKKNGISPIVFVKTEQDFERLTRENKKILELNTGWKVPTWREDADLYLACSVMDDKGNRVPNPVQYRYARLAMYLKTWDAGSPGKTREVSSREIDLLQYETAGELLDGFDKVVGMSEGETQAFEREAKAYFAGEWRWSYGPEPIIYEWILARATGWSLEYIRSLQHQVFHKLLRLAIICEGADKSFEAELATAGLPKRRM